MPHFDDLAYLPITELQNIALVGFKSLRCLTHGDHNSIDTIYQDHLKLLVMGKAFHIEGDVLHMVVNFHHPFGVVI